MGLVPNTGRVPPSGATQAWLGVKASAARPSRQRLDLGPQGREMHDPVQRQGGDPKAPSLVDKHRTPALEGQLREAPAAIDPRQGRRRFVQHWFGVDRHHALGDTVGGHQ